MVIFNIISIFISLDSYLHYGEKSDKILLLQKQLGDNENEKIFRSLRTVKFKILDGLHKVILKEKEKYCYTPKTTNNIGPNCRFITKLKTICKSRVF